MTQFHLHLISDSTGETVSSVARSILVQFEGVEVEEHYWSLIRTRGQVDKIIEEVKEHRGFVMYTLADEKLRQYLKAQCDALNVPNVSVLSRIISDFSRYLGMKVTTEDVAGKQHEMNEEYFSRVEAINYALNHDDGQGSYELDEADVVIVGASRTSKSPTCMYLAYRGYQAANIPFVSGIPLPQELDQLKHTLVVGLTINPERLVQIRRNRLLSIDKDNSDTNYTDLDEVKEELVYAQRLFTRKGWPVIDVTRSSVEETTAKIIQFHQTFKAANKE